MKKLKVYGHYGFNRFGRQQRCVTAAHSFAEAAKIFDVSLHYLRNWGAVTGNKEEIKAALKNPGKVIWMGGEI